MVVVKTKTDYQTLSYCKQFSIWQLLGSWSRGLIPMAKLIKFPANHLSVKSWFVSMTTKTN